MPDIFISYRREDASGYAGRLNDQLAAHFGADHVFIDVDDISPGVDFAQAIEKKVSSCDILLALIGRRWLNSRLDDPNDFVRREIGTALDRNIRVIPVLVDGAAIPQAHQLPPDLSMLARRQVLEISDSRFHDDVNRLIRSIEPQAETLLRSRRVWALAALVLAVAAGGIYVSRSSKSHPQPTEAKTIPKIAAPNIAGKWRAELRDERQRPYNIRLSFQVGGNQLFGTVSYPTGDGAILEGKIQGDQIDFLTKHVPQFESEPATIRIHGTIVNDEIQLIVSSDSGVSQGTARRVVPVKAAFCILLLSAILGGQSPDEWPAYGRDPGGTRYSPLSQIHRENVTRLNVAWTFHTGDMYDPNSRSKRGRASALETTPLFVDGTLYLSTPFGRVIALDPEKGNRALGLRPQGGRRRRLRGFHQSRRGHMGGCENKAAPHLHRHDRRPADRPGCREREDRSTALARVDRSICAKAYGSPPKSTPNTR